jgi:hypothetical protein
MNSYEDCNDLRIINEDELDDEWACPKTMFEKSENKKYFEC